MHNNYTRYGYLWSTLLGCHLYSWVDCRYSPMMKMQELKFRVVYV